MSYNEQIGQQHFLVSMCTFNGEAWVNEAIQSVLDQSFCNWHLYITDDGSSDSTTKILTQFKNNFPEKITLNLLEQNCSPQTPTNFSIRFFLQNERFSAFTILDQDDAAEPDWLSNCSKLLKGKTKVLRCKNARFNETLTEMKYIYPAASQIVALREVIKRVGERVDRNHPVVSDTEYLKRVERDAISNRYAVVLTPFLCQKMRIHGANQTILGTTKPA
jgi:glycosyltransferase involved in cell wall biosynthesis